MGVQMSVLSPLTVGNGAHASRLEAEFIFYEPRLFGGHVQHSKPAPIRGKQIYPNLPPLYERESKPDSPSAEKMLPNVGVLHARAKAKI